MSQSPSHRGLQIPKRPRFQLPVLSPLDMSALPRKPFQWITRHIFCGTGLHQTATFRIGDRWRLVWSCDQATVEKPSYVIVLKMKGPGGSSGDSSIQTVCVQHTTSNMDELQGGGQLFLRIICAGEWTVEVQERKQ